MVTLYSDSRIHCDPVWNWQKFQNDQFATVCIRTYYSMYYYGKTVIISKLSQYPTLTLSILLSLYRPLSQVRNLDAWSNMNEAGVYVFKIGGRDVDVAGGVIQGC